jgi:hypothetical protein
MSPVERRTKSRARWASRASPRKASLPWPTRIYRMSASSHDELSADFLFGSGADSLDEPALCAISGNSSSERATAIADIQIAPKMMPTAARASSRRVTSNLSLFRKGKSIIGLDSEVSDKIAHHLARYEGVGAITGDLRRKVKTCVVIRPRSRCLRDALHAIFPLSHAEHRY